MQEHLFTAYRVMSYVTGVILALLVFVGMPLKYGFDKPAMVEVTGTAHGFLFMVYVALVLVVGYLFEWSLLKIVGVAAAGTVPLAVFFVEPRVVKTHEANARNAVEATP